MISSAPVTRSILCLMVDFADEGLESFRRSHIHSPGRDVPMHVTLAYRFPLPDKLDSAVSLRLEHLACHTEPFKLAGMPLSSFPKSKVLYLTPSPISPLEALLDALDVSFPELELTVQGYPVFHLTLAMGYREEEQHTIIAEYFARFGKEPLKLTASRLCVYIESHGVWSEHLSYPLNGPDDPGLRGV